MAKKKKKKDPLDFIKLPSLDIDPDIKKGILVVIILAFGAICLLSLFNMAGSMGQYLSYALAYLFGWGEWIPPVLLLIWGYFLYRDGDDPIKGTNYFGGFLFLLSFQTLLELFLEADTWEQVLGTTQGGGWLGLVTASAFVKLLGFWASLIVVLGLILIALMLMFNRTLHDLIGRDSWLGKALFHPVRFLFAKIFKRGEKDEEEEEEEEENDEEENEEEDQDEEEEENEEEENDDASGDDESEEGDDDEDDEEEEKKRKATASSNKPVMKTAKKEDDIHWVRSNIKINLPMDLLNSKVGKSVGGDIKNNAVVIKRTLENFGIPIEIGEVLVGPTVTQYTFKPAEGVKLSRVTALNNDLALALAAHPIRIEAPIPGKALVGLEVPNQVKAVVNLKETLSDAAFVERKSNLMIALGKDVAGKTWLYDLARMPHLLVAGATNSGKSVCLNTIIISLLYQNDPDDLKFIMVDPKRVELPSYNGIPHLLTPVITDVQKTINALKWCLNEMDQRLEVLGKHNAKNIAIYNKNAKEKMPYIVFIIDELADLMLVAAKEVEAGIIRLTQMARAVGIHLILATQRPSVDIITGVIKANMPARIAFAVASGIDSRTIIDSLGAEKLLGFGDMLFTAAEISKPKRIQGAYVSDNEIKNITRYIKEHGGEVKYVEGVTDRQKVRGVAGVGLDGSTSDDEDELLAEAKEIVINSGKASASYLQRRLSIGYARAARILDLLEEAGIVGPSNGAKPREILISKEQYENMIAQGVSGMPLHNRDEAEAPDSYLGEDDDDGDTDEEEESDEEDEEQNEEDAGNEETTEEDDDRDAESEDDEGDSSQKEKIKKKRKMSAHTRPSQERKPIYSDDDEDGIFFSR